MPFKELSYEQYLDYFQNVLALELKRYETDEIINRLQSKISSLRITNEKITNKSVKVKTSFIPNLLRSIFYGLCFALLFGLIGAFVGLIVWVIMWFIFVINESSNGNFFSDIFFFLGNILFGGLPEFETPLLPYLLWGAVIPAIPIFIYIMISEIVENHALPTKKQVSDAVNSELSVNNARVKRLAEQAVQYKRLCSQLDNTLNKYYSFNLIDRKAYGNLVAVGTIYGYFKHKLCSGLYGHEGALALYEHDLKLNIIIEKLDTIITRLDAIEGTQRILADRISNSNYKITSVCNAMMDKLDTANYNLETLNYYESVNSTNIKYLTWANTHFF